MDANEIIASITERVKDAANVKVVFGDPIEVGGVTVIPVASIKVSGGGGGGRGRGRSRESEENQPAGKERGMGLGLRVAAMPLGYIEVKDGNARFVSITDVTKIAVSGMVAAATALLSVNSLIRFMMLRKRQKMWQRYAHRYAHRKRGHRR